jgi:uncharacterized surface protein with fasciclin (FAS1) repeats
VKSRTSKALGVAASVAAIALSVPLSINAYAQPTTPSPVPVAEIPEPEGPGCDALKQAVPNYKDFNKSPATTVLSSIPDISTFNSAITGQLNPAVNLTSVIDNGPYVIFAPTNEAFAKLPPGQLDALKADPAGFTSLLYYHMFLGILGQNDVQGQRPTQQGAEISVKGKGGDITINDTAKVLCGAIHGENSRVYLIDTVLDPSTAPAPITPSATSTTSTTPTTTTTETTASTAPLPVAPVPPTGTPTPAAEAPVG